MSEVSTTTTKEQQAVIKAAITKVEKPGQVMMIDPKKCKQGQRLTEWNCQNTEKLKAQESTSKFKLTSGQYYGIGAVMAVRALGNLGYYVYQSEKRDATKVTWVHQSKEGV